MPFCLQNYFWHSFNTAIIANFFLSLQKFISMSKYLCQLNLHGSQRKSKRDCSMWKADLFNKLRHFFRIVREFKEENKWSQKWKYDADLKSMRKNCQSIPLRWPKLNSSFDKMKNCVFAHWLSYWKHFAVVFLLLLLTFSAFNNNIIIVPFHSARCYLCLCRNQWAQIVCKYRNKCQTE